MGYTTEFSGEFKLDKPLTVAQVAYLKRFADTRRMKRDAEKTAQRDDPARKRVELDVGPDGAYFVGATGFAGQEHDDDVVEYNSPPTGQPGLWCQWIPAEDGEIIEWDGGEKFYEYVAWIEYIIKHFLTPWGRKLTGRVSWVGEEPEDRGVILITDNEVQLADDVISNPLDDVDA